MGIRKQEFYEGAALHLLARTGKIESLRYQAPLFEVNESILVLLKYSTKGRSPWGFTFSLQEQEILCRSDSEASFHVHLALVCGSDGVVSISYEAFLKIVPYKGTAARLSCFRDHGEHYQISGPAGLLDRKVSRSCWQRILDV